MRRMTRAFRRLVARLMIGIVLLAQFAVASHACALAAATVRSPMPAMAMHDGAPCAEAAAAAGSPGAAPADVAAGSPLCAGHCQLGQQSADPSPAPSVAPALVAALYVLPAAPPPAGAAGAPGQALPPRAGSSPPLAILHCCLRD